ncbi:MAG: FmdB family zinc ribbon protein [Terriglobales bacterium]
MPIFEYLCQDCGKTFERLSWGSEQTPTCGCGSQKAERVWYSRVAVATGGHEGDFSASDSACGEGACCGGGDDGGCCRGGGCDAGFDD